MRLARRPEILHGRVNSDGTIWYGEGFQCIKSGTGIYLIKGPAGFKARAATVTPFVSASAFCAATDFIDNTFVVRCYAWNTANTPGDCPFNFICVGG